jgi:hypothetical protein
VLSSQNVIWASVEISEERTVTIFRNALRFSETAVLAYQTEE